MKLCSLRVHLFWLSNGSMIQMNDFSDTCESIKFPAAPTAPAEVAACFLVPLQAASLSKNRSGGAFGGQEGKQGSRCDSCDTSD